jgi:hypothetical protein
MADTNSDLIAAKAAAKLKLSDGILNGDDAGGVLLYFGPEVTLPAGVTANDTFQLIDLPPGAVIVPELCRILASGDPGTTLTIDVGDSADIDRYCDGANLGALSAAGVVMFTDPAMPAAALTPYRSSDVSRVYATAATAGTVTAATVLKFTIVARVKG